VDGGTWPSGLGTVSCWACHSRMDRLEEQTLNSLCLVWGRGFLAGVCCHLLSSVGCLASLQSWAVLLSCGSEGTSPSTKAVGSPSPRFPSACWSQGWLMVSRDHTGLVLAPAGRGSTAFAVAGKVGEVAPELAIIAAFREKHWFCMKPRLPTTCVSMAYGHV